MLTADRGAVALDPGFAPDIRDEEGLLHTGMTPEKMFYIAAERQERSASDDHRGDVFSLGALMYAALCGGAPNAETGGISLDHSHFGDAPDRLQQLVRDLVGPDPGRRATLTDVLAPMPVFDVDELLPSASTWPHF